MEIILPTHCAIFLAVTLGKEENSSAKLHLKSSILLSGIDTANCSMSKTLTSV